MFGFKSLSLKTLSAVACVAAFSQIFLSACGEMKKADNEEAAEDYPEITANLRITAKKILLRTSSGHFITAINGGGREVLAVATFAGMNENWTLYDLNGGTLDSGDLVVMRARKGHFMAAINGGGDRITTTTRFRSPYSVFKIIDLNRQGTIERGDSVALQAPNGQYFVAEGGGGSLVNANRGNVGSWETFAFGITGEEIPPPPATPAPGPEVNGTRITLQTNNGMFVTAENGGGRRVLGTGAGAGEYEQWAVNDLNGGNLESGDVIALQARSGHFMVAEGGGGGVVNANRFGIGPWERFVITSLNRSGAIRSGDSVAIKAEPTGLYFAAEGGGGDVINANRGGIGPWETFIIRGLPDVAQPTPTPTPGGGGGSGSMSCYPGLGRTDREGAVREAATWVRNNRLHHFRPDNDRAGAYLMMTDVLNILRHNGHNVGRTLPHPSLPPSNPYRWGSDALGYHQSGNNWYIVDVYGSWPDPGRPQYLEHGIGTNAEVTSDLVGIGQGTRCP